MEKKNKKGLYVFLGLVALVLVIGVTYAFITITLQGTKENSITGGSLKVVLNDTDESLGNGAGDITISDAFPVTDAVGMTKTPYTFTLSNDGDKDASYTVYLDEDAVDEGNTRMDDSQVKVGLTNGADEVLGDLPKKVSELGDKVTRTIGTGESARTVTSNVLYSGVLEHGKMITFVLRLWIADDADETVMGKQYATKVSVDAVQVPEYAVTVINPVAVDENTPQETISKPVFKTATATFQVKAGTGTPSITCTNGVTATATVNAEDATKVDVTVSSVENHTVCTITYAG